MHDFRMFPLFMFFFILICIGVGVCLLELGQYLAEHIRIVWVW